MKRKRDETPTTVESIKWIERRIGESAKNVNLILALQSVLETEEDGVLIDAAAVSLAKVFTRFWRYGQLRKPVDGSKHESQDTVTIWLRERYSDFVRNLRELLGHRDAGLQRSALVLLLRMLKEEGTESFPKSLYRRIIESLFDAGVGDAVLDEFSISYLNVYDDLRLLFFSTTKSLSQQARADSDSKRRTRIVARLLKLLSGITTMPTQESEIDQFWCAEASSSLVAHRKVFQECWLSLLSLRMTEEQYRSVLVVMHKRIVPHMLRPQFLMDFLTDCYNSGGTTSLLALNGLFHLIQKYNLDYPDFYPKLYALFSEDLMHVRYRSRFFRLVDIFLSSTHLPAALVASFIKRMSRLALTAPPSAIVAIIPFVYNLLKRHLSCTVLIHRSREVSTGFEDPFVAEEKDPNKSNALESSLWELETLQSHYHPNVATLARILSEKLTKPNYNLEDFLDHSYDTMLSAEFARRLKKEPALEFEKPVTLFKVPRDVTDSENEVALESASVMAQLWHFP